MKVIKAFASHALFTSNVKNVVNPIGELSTQARTYAKDRGIYSKEDQDNIRLHTFNTSENGEYFELNSDLVNHIFAIIDSVYKRVTTSALEWSDQAEEYLISTHSSIANTFRIGEIVKTDTHSCPGWISWKRNDMDLYVQIWFCDDVFRRTFDEYEISVVPPIVNVDDFFKRKDKVVEILQKENAPTPMSERGHLVKDNKPETILKSLMFDWVDRTNPTDKIPVRWDLLIYGLRGDNIDAIKDSIVDYVLEHSVYPEEDWKKVFPEIFKRTEFTIVPRWDNYAIHERSTVEGIYSPIVKAKEIFPILKKFALKKYGYTDAHIEEYGQVMAHQFKSLQCLVVSHPENRDKKFYLSEVYPDYIAEHSLSNDFNRMMKETRDWAEGIAEMIIEAENFKTYSGVPLGMTRLTREGKLFLVKTFNNVHYLVAVKANFEEE